MADKTKTSPLKQGWAGSMASLIGAQMQPQMNTAAIGVPTSTQPGTGSMTGGVQAAMAATQGGLTGPAIPGRNFSNNNMIKTQQTPISPKALSNQGAITSMFGSPVAGTFNRNISPLAQSAQGGEMTSQGYMPGIDPTNASAQPTMDALQASTGMPLPPPSGVQQPISPYYDLSN